MLELIESIKDERRIFPIRIDYLCLQTEMEKICSRPSAIGTRLRTLSRSRRAKQRKQNFADIPKT